jgi:excisionase family DNA binding protein
VDFTHSEDLLMLTVARVAAALGVSARQVRRWIRAGTVRAITTPGGHYRVRQEELDRLLGGVTA